MESQIRFLLDEVQLFFTPVTGEFDIELITQRLFQTGFALAHPKDPGSFAIFAEKKSYEDWNRRLKLDPSQSFPYVLRIKVQANLVIIWPESEQEDLKSLSAQFVEWMIQHRPCRITNEFGTDITDKTNYETSGA